MEHLRCLLLVFSFTQIFPLFYIKDDRTVRILMNQFLNRLLSRNFTRPKTHFGRPKPSGKCKATPLHVRKFCGKKTMVLIFQIKQEYYSMIQNKYQTEQYLSRLAISLRYSMDTIEITYVGKDLLKNHFICCYIILHRSCVDDEYLNLFSARIHIRQEARNRFYRSLNMLLIHQLIYSICASIMKKVTNGDIGERGL